MTLDELTLPMLWTECRSLALVYPYDVAVILYGVQQAHGDPRHIPAGRELTDGRWMLCGDVLSEVGPGGILHRAFEYITAEMMHDVEVMSLADAVALLPPDQQTP